ncbi:ABC transporter permease [Pseudonocardia sp. TRM90224]|uniref:ABC transporter permease n=1 Tax=Pseudonocardia sp. TRM90224 TaxID=2812678 RepID=UPI001E5D1770|nr:ABC transporter permease [Pseudonocardia sp. TRM90224]
MNVLQAWLRLELRRRWRFLVALALLVALATGIVFTAVAGARRGASSVDRLMAVSHPADVTVVPNVAGAAAVDWAAVRALPQVDVLALFVPDVPILADELPTGLADAGLLTVPLDREGLSTIERPAVLAGRAADPDRPDEAVVTPRFVEAFGLGVGDMVTLRLFSPERVDAIKAALVQPTGPDGPVVPTRIVGVVALPYFGDDLGANGRLLPSVGLAARYPGSIRGANGSVPAAAFVRLHGGAADVPAFREGVRAATGNPGIEVSTEPGDKAVHARELVGFQAAWLLAFGLAALAAAALVIGQSVARHVRSESGDLASLRAIGLTRAELRRLAAAGPLLAATAGTVVGAAISVVASAWFPVGTAAAFDPQPGVSVDALVLVVGVPAVLGLVVVAAAVATRPVRSPWTVARGSSIAASAARVGMPVPVVVGLRFALEPGVSRGGGRVPVRPAIVGAVAGVLGVVASFTVAAGVADALAEPARFGQAHSAAAYLGDLGTDGGDSAAALALLDADPEVTGLLDLRYGDGSIGDTTITVFEYHPVGQGLPIIMTAGREPRDATEVVLGPSTARLLGVTPGATVPITGDRGTRDLRVSGFGFVPEGTETNAYTDGVWVTPDGYDVLLSSFSGHGALFALVPGVSPEAAAERLTAEIAAKVPGGENIGIFSGFTPQRASEVESIRAFPLLLGAFLAVLAAGAVGHAVATAVRHRRGDLGLLRALGMTKAQTGAVVLVQACALGVAGLVIGVPLGLAAGRIVWRGVADLIPLQYLPPVAGTAVALVIPLTLVVAALVAVLPGRAATRTRINDVLRAE